MELVSKPELSKKIILSIKNLEKTYPNGVKALKNVSFDVSEGEFLVIIGLSGSGKSTLLRCINRLHEPTSGQIIYDNTDIAHLDNTQVRHIRREIGMIFQNFNLIPRHTVLSNVLMGRLAYTSTIKSLFGIFSKADIANALNYLDLVGIKDKANVRSENLSGGQQQRVAIARVLAQNPKIILADEPVASLDPSTCHAVMDYLKKINRDFGITVICNLHFLSLVREYASRVIALKAGQIVYQRAPQEINDAWFEKIYGEGAKEVHIK